MSANLTDAMQARERVRGLDSLRFVAALWVVFSHVGLAPLFAGLPLPAPADFLFRGLLGVLFCGPAAVIVFFIISGFCIHYPYAAGAPFGLAPYLTRRYIRICIPMLAAMLLAEAAGIDSGAYFEAILWSLVAELMYYTLYPLIRKLLRSYSVLALVAVAYLLSFAIFFIETKTPGYATYGWKLNWLLGLPCWLLGVKVAEEWFQRSRAPHSSSGRMSIWDWRIMIWAASSVCAALNFHSPLPFSVTLNIFAIPASLWIIQELRRANYNAPPWATLEWAGKWSYSIYLCHMIVVKLQSRWPSLSSFTPAPSVSWITNMGLILVGSYFFYLFVEQPAHILARRIGKLVTLQRPAM